jgi:hypothetical protein
MKKNISIVAFFGLSFLVLLPLGAQIPAEGYDYDGRAIVSILPFVGEEEAAATFDLATAGAVTALQKYNPRQVTSATVSAAGLRIPTDMPPVRELALGARYALTGGVYPGNYEHEYYIQLWLWDMSSSTMIYTDDLVYQNIAEALDTLPGLVEWLFSHIVEVTLEPEPASEKGWEDKLINLGLRSGFSQRWYMAPNETASGAYALNFEEGIFVSVFLNSFLSLQAEVNFTWDSLVYRGISNIGDKEYIPVLANEKYTSYSMTFPLFFKVNFRPGNLRIAPFAGLYAFAPLGDASYRKSPAGEEETFSQSVDFPMGLIVGLEGAVKFGPGMIITDIRYLGDFGAVTIHDASDIAYNRRAFSFTLGYAFGFINLKGQGDPL